LGKRRAKQSQKDKASRMGEDQDLQRWPACWVPEVENPF